MSPLDTLSVDTVINEISEDERERIEDTARSIAKPAQELAPELREELAEYWRDEAESSLDAARVLARVAPADISRTHEAYYAIKDAVVQSLVFRHSSALLTREKEESAHTFDRKVGETLDEYKTRIKKYMDELE